MRVGVGVCARGQRGGGVTCISLSELFGLRKTLKRVLKILRVVVTWLELGLGLGLGR